MGVAETGSKLLWCFSRCRFYSEMRRAVSGSSKLKREKASSNVMECWLRVLECSGQKETARPGRSFVRKSRLFKAAE
jgi:hypothetical protein